MKKDKEWLKKETEKLYKHDEAYLNPDDIVVENYQTVTSILELIDQLDEPEQVVPSKMETTTPTVSKKEIVVPQFVADWIEKRKDDFKSSYDAVTYIKSCGWDDEAHVEYEVYEWLPENLLTFCKAWELGYTVEQPKLLTVIVKDYYKTIMSKQLPEDEVNKMMEGLE